MKNSAAKHSYNRLDQESKNLLHKGISDMQANEYIKALDELNYFIRLNPKNPVGYYNIGIIYLKKNDYPNAIKFWEKALIVDPDYSDAYYNLGLAYKLRKNNRKAVENYAKFLIHNPDFKQKQKIVDEIQQIREPFVGKDFIGRISMTDTAIYEKNISFKNQSIFSKEVPVIYSCIEVVDAPNDSELEASWYYYVNDNPILVNSNSFKTHGSKNIIIKLTRPQNSWPTGEYEFQLSSGEKEIIKVPFYINL